MQVTPRRASGFGEFLPGDQIEYNRLATIIRETYEKYGFSPIDTPVLELTEVLLAKEAGETSKQVYSVSKGSNEFTMRFDLTVPLARYVAEHENDLVFPFRRYHIGKVYRAERPQAGRFREFMQCDIDVIGSNSPLIDAEFPAIINEIFEQFNFGEFTIRLNDRRVLNGFFESLKLAPSANNILRIIDKMEKISREELIRELSESNLTQTQIDSILGFTAIRGTNDEIIAQLRNIPNQTSSLIDGVDKLETLVSTLRLLNVPESRFIIDLRIARGLDYYTGTVYETTLNEHPSIGSVCSGGRYDNLAGVYTKTPLSGVGVSIGLSRLFYQLREAGIIQPKKQSVASVMVMPFETIQIDEAIAAAAGLRASNIPVTLYTEQGKLDKKMRFANRMGYKYVVQIGAREVEMGTVSVRDMEQGTSVQVSLSDLATYVSR